MLYRELIAASFENHTKHLGLNELCEENIEFFSIIDKHQHMHFFSHSKLY